MASIVPIVGIIVGPLAQLANCGNIGIFLRDHLSYLFRSKKKIQNLEKERKILLQIRDDVQQRLAVAHREGNEPSRQVDGWLEDVTSFEAKAMDIPPGEAGDIKCLLGICPNCVSRYKNGKKAVSLVENVKKLIERSEQVVDNISNLPPPPSFEPRFVSDLITSDSAQSVERAIIDALQDSETSILGVWGMPGVGKTTLMKRLNNEIVSNLSFIKKVIMVTVSENPEWQEIQARIGERIGLKLTDIDEVARANRLFKRLLEERPFLIILDDVWGRFEANEIGIPCGTAYKDCKVVITTRMEDVCREMGIKKIAFNRLTEEESRALFRMKAGEVATLPNIQDVADAIVKKCDGLPLAIVTLGESLRDERDAMVWKDTLRRFASQVPMLISSIEFSFEQLKDEMLKVFFLFCCIYPADYNIPLSDLRMYGVGEGLFRAPRNLEEASDTLHAYVSRLKKCSLLLDGDWEDTVKVHDVVRDVGISISSNVEYGFWVGAGRNLYRWPMEEDLMDNKRISLMGNDIRTLPDKLECPTLLTLQLEGNRSLSIIPASFFQGTKELRVLNLERSGISSMSCSSLSCLSNLRVLNLNYCLELDDISPLGKLKKLEILALQDTRIRELPKEIGELITLRVLDLTRTIKLKKIPPKVILRLTLLEELYMAGSFSAWEIGIEGSESASITEVMSMAFLTTLVLRIENVEFLNLDIRDDVWQNLRKFQINVHPASIAWYSSSISKSASDLFLSRLQYPIRSWVKPLLEKAVYLVLDCCSQLEAIPQHYAKGFVYLKTLDIRNCNGIRHLIYSVEDPLQVSAFGQLESLYLYGLDNLELFCHGNFPDGFLSNLRILDIKKCCKLQCILTPNISKAMPNLEKLRVVDCASIENLSSVTGTSSFSALKNLRVENCVNFWSFVTYIGEDSFKCLESLLIVGCEKMEYIFYAGEMSIATNAFNKLQNLYLEDMGNLVSLFNGKLFPGNIRDLYISSCPKLADIDSYFLQQWLETIEAMDIIDMGKMEYLLNIKDDSVLRPLVSLSRLYISQFEGMSIFNGSLQQESLNNLEDLIILKCEGLVSVFPSDVVLRLISLEYLSIRDCDMLQELFISDQFASDAIVFPNLDTLRLENLPKLAIIQGGFLGRGSFQNLKMLHVVGCEKLKYLFSRDFAQRLHGIEWIAILNCPHLVDILLVEEEPSLHNLVPTSSNLFMNLREIAIKECHRLQRLFSFGCMRCLQRLEIIQIADCEEIGNIFNAVTDDKLHNPGLQSEPFLPNLRILLLAHLPKLTSFINGSTILNFLSLKCLVVWKCENMKSIALGPQSALDLEKFFGEQDWFDNLEMQNDRNLHSRMSRVFTNEDDDEALRRKLPKIFRDYARRSFNFFDVF